MLYKSKLKDSGYLLVGAEEAQVLGSGVGTLAEAGLIWGDFAGPHALCPVPPLTRLR